MNILHIAYSLGESSAATRLAVLQEEKDKVYFFVGRLSKFKYIRNRQVYPYITYFFGVLYHILEVLYCKIFGISKSEVFSFGLSSYLQNLILRKTIKKYKIDIVHLHWGGYGFFPLNAFDGIVIKKVITAHDYQFFTGGCHIPMDCENIKKNCENCPILKNKSLKKVVSSNFLARIKFLERNSIKISAPSLYTSNYIHSINNKLEVKVIPNVLGTQYPHDSACVDEMIELYQSRKKNGYINLVVVGIGRSERDNKGAIILDYVFERLKSSNLNYIVNAVGVHLDCVDQTLIMNHGNLASTDLARLYAISDLCLVPSRYETFSQVTLEAIACCTPVVAFDLSGPKDIIRDNESGFLVPAFDLKAYYENVYNNVNYKQKNLVTLRKCALEAMNNYSGQSIVKKYHEFYIDGM